MLLMAPEAKTASKTLVVTSALPYANGDIHLGHLVEAVQTDIFVRYRKMRGNHVVYVCADDTHGTPIELNALKRGISCEELIAEAWKNHVADYAGFSIGFDTFYSTNSPENRRWSEHIYKCLGDKGLLLEHDVEHYYCEHDKRFLPDRFVVGTCPRCKAEDQYGDVCEACGATYDSSELEKPRCTICDAPPVLKKSRHFFVDLAKRADFLREFTAAEGVLSDEMRNFVTRWIDGGLRDWCISRDGPYFGFRIPGQEDKYFYVWLDAPVGYIASTEKWCADNGRDIADYWGKGAACDVFHFIGKDIVYFHALFWPVMLDAADVKLPTRIFVHGFLTVNGAKMSKTRGTFILAREYLQRLKHPSATEYLRFYYGAKLTSSVADIDLCTDEFCSKINTTLVNNIGNLHHRTFVFLDRYFGSEVPDVPWDEGVARKVEEAARKIARNFENVETRAIVDSIHALGNLGNRYYQDKKPWELVKKDNDEAAAVMVTCANLVKAVAVFLKPFVPNLVAGIEEQLGIQLQWDDYRFSLRGHKLKATEIFAKPIRPEEFRELFAEATDDGLLDIEDVLKPDLRIGTIKSAEPVPKSNKLLKLSVDTGDRVRQLVAGVAKTYAAEDLVGRQVVVVVNLKPATLMGVKSEGMLLAASTGKRLSLVQPDSVVEPGTKIS